MKKTLMLASAAGAVLVAGSANAQETPGTPAYDLSPLVDAVDFGQVVTAVLGIAAALMAVYVVMRGIRFIYQAVR